VDLCFHGFLDPLFRRDFETGSGQAHLNKEIESGLVFPRLDAPWFAYAIVQAAKASSKT
jgi:hypothetical protein